MSYFVEKHFSKFLLRRRNKSILFHAHLTASNIGELANQNAAYKIIALEFRIFRKYKNKCKPPD